MSGEFAERVMWETLKKHLENRKSDALFLRSFKFLHKNDEQEKDMICINLSTGVALAVFLDEKADSENTEIPKVFNKGKQSKLNVKVTKFFDFSLIPLTILLAVE